MPRKIKRTSNYQLTLDINNESFISPPRESQKTWILNRLVTELSYDLEHLSAVSSSMLPGAEVGVSLDREQSSLSDNDIMEDWQIPIMKKMAEFVTESGGDVLEIGMGRGVASDFIQSFSPKSHTLIECNDFIVSDFPNWKNKHPGCNANIIHGMWQDKWHEVGEYDGILFHTYPLTHEEFVEHVAQSTTFAEHFFAPASEKLRSGGVLTYLTNENDSLSRAHQRSLLKHFSRFTVSVIDDLNIPDDSRDSCWLPQMVLVRAEK